MPTVNASGLNSSIDPVRLSIEIGQVPQAHRHRAMTTCHRNSAVGRMTTSETREQSKDPANRAGNLLFNLCLVGAILSFFFVTILINPQSLAWFGLAQTTCELPNHSKCVAPGLVFDATAPSTDAGR
jgi:hypothetical protein